MINCTLTFRTTNVIGYLSGIMAQFELVKPKSPILHYIAHSSVHLWNHTQLNNMRVSTPTTTILLTITGTFYSLNWFCHMILAPQTSTYQNIAKLFIRLCILSITLWKSLLSLDSSWSIALNHYWINCHMKKTQDNKISCRISHQLLTND